MNQSLILFSPSGRAATPRGVRRAVQRLRELGFDARLDEAALARRQRFAGSDEARLEAIHRVAAAAPSVAMAVRGGYGLTRLLDAIRWKALAKAVGQGTRFVGHSDFTALQLALLAHTGAGSWAGPTGSDDFGREGELDDVTVGCFAEAMRGELEAIGFRTDDGFDGLETRGTLWGGNLSMICSLLGTPHLPDAKRVPRGILFIEDVNEHPYRVERMLLQLLQAGVLQRQKALLIGQISAWKPSPLDSGYGLKAMVAHLRSSTKLPILTGLPFGHVPTKVSLPIGRRCTLAVQGRSAFLGWA